jgi:hypothetical protein
MMASLSNEKRDLPMRRIEVSGHIAQAVAMEYMATAAQSNPNFEDRSVCGWDVEFRECHPADKAHPDERVACVLSCNRARTVVAVALVGPGDN